MTTTAETTPSFAAQRRAAAGAERRTAPRRSMDGTVLGSVVLDPEVFGIVPNAAVLHQVITAQLAAARAGTQSTRTRAEVAGGGAKPFRQKGTGRSRQGSIRSPQWVGGGIAFGPKPRSYRQRTPKKMIRLALRSALSDRAELGRVVVVDAWGFGDEPRTKEARRALDALELWGRVLVVIGDEDVVAERSFRNLTRVQVVPAVELNAYDILRSDWVLFSDHTLPGTAEHIDAPAAAPAGRATGAADEPVTDATATDATATDATATDEPVTAADEPVTDEPVTDTAAIDDVDAPAADGDDEGSTP